MGTLFLLTGVLGASLVTSTTFSESISSKIADEERAKLEQIGTSTIGHECGKEKMEALPVLLADKISQAVD